MEGTILGIKSIALSQAFRSAEGREPYWDTALRFGPDIVRRVLREGVPDDVLVNVNFPDCPPEDVKGIAVTAQGRRLQERLQIDARRDGRGNLYYWIAYIRARGVEFPQGTDMGALAENRISVTPLRLDLTDEPYMTRLTQAFGE